jgi:peptidoglycan/LPS O-acetylase OafA/YrhL
MDMFSNYKGVLGCPRNDSPREYLKYRPDIDGLRAFAILSVVLYHAFPSFMRGGFIGVDVFFVISGYLIAEIIFKELDSDKFSFINFYQRRVKRIFPALILVLITCYAVGWFTLMATEFKMLGKHLVGGIGFIQNIVLYREAGYFDTSSELKPLLHLWSLGVEEQFYILFPIAAWAFWRSRVPVLPIIIVLALASFGAGVLKLTTNPSAAFYMPQYRFWEILLGSILAYCAVDHSYYSKVQSSVPCRNLCSLLGAVLLVLSVVIIDKHKAFPGSWAVLPVFGSVLMILAGPQAWLNKQVLASRLMVWIGLISYPLYLWHWVVITYIRIIGANELSILSGIFAVSISVALAYFTYKFVELPFRKVQISVPKVAILLAIGSTVAAVGALSFFKNGIPYRPGLPASIKDREEYAQYFENSLPGWVYFTKQGILDAYRAECDFFDLDSYRVGNSMMEPRKQIGAGCYVPKHTTKVMIWGDSHAQQYYFGLSKTLPSTVSILQVTSSGCEPNFPSVASNARKYCD